MPAPPVLAGTGSLYTTCPNLYHSEHAALHFARADRLGDRLGIVGIVVRRIQLLWPDIDRFVAEPLQLVDKPIFQVEADMIGANVDFFSHTRPSSPVPRPRFKQSFVSPWLSQQSVSRPTGPQLCSSACSPHWQCRTPSESYRKSRPLFCARGPASSPRARHSRSLTRRR